MKQDLEKKYLVCKASSFEAQNLNLTLHLFLTHIIKPDSNFVVETIKYWNDDCQEDFWNVSYKLKVILLLNQVVNPLLKRSFNTECIKTSNCYLELKY